MRGWVGHGEDMNRTHHITQYQFKKVRLLSLKKLCNSDSDVKKNRVAVALSGLSTSPWNGPQIGTSVECKQQFNRIKWFAIRFFFFRFFAFHLNLGSFDQPLLVTRRKGVSLIMISRFNWFC